MSASWSRSETGSAGRCGRWNRPTPTPTSAGCCAVRRRAPGWRRSQALTIYFAFLELRHQVELHALTGRVVACPIDEMNRPRGRKDAKLRIPPTDAEIDTLFTGWAEELATCRKFAPTARNYAAARLMAEVGLRVNEARSLDLDDIKWDLGPFGKLHVRFGKGARGSGPRERMVPLINDAGRTLRWFIEDVWGHFGDDHTRPRRAAVPVRAPRRRGTPPGRLRRAARRAGRRGHRPSADWTDKLTPHVLRHYCARSCT